MIAVKTDGKAAADNLLWTIASRWRQVKRHTATGRRCVKLPCCLSY